jgi:divalent metal cation (Fe/Co/Zn/Cd) transporter
MNVNALARSDTDSLYKWASALAVITILYNLVEGVVSVAFGLGDESLSLLGFGVDSFVEVISGFGVWHMVQRIRRNPDSTRDRFERVALRITGTAFYILFVGLLATAVVNLITGHQPEATVWGIVVASVSIVTMWLLIYFKRKVGRALDSQAILADANCTRACLYLSVVLLVASVGYEVTGIGGIDTVGALIIAVLALKEGREAFQKAKGLACCCDDA